MAELTGLAVGVVSLGLQVASGLSDYVDSVKGRKEELESTKKQSDTMKDSLLTIQEFLPQLKNSSPKSASMIERQVNACNSELSALHALLSELCQPSSSSSSIRSKLSEQKKRMVYPFNRSHLVRLEDRLTKVNSALQTALSITTINLLFTHKNEIIHQFKDTVAPLLSQQAMRTQSAITYPTTTSSSVRFESLTNSGSRAQLHSIGTAMALASKPSLLSASMDTWTKYNTLSSRYGRVAQACLCRRSRNTVRLERSWGGILFSSETSTTRRHSPDCPFSRADGEVQASQFAVGFRGLSALFNNATVLSFCYTRDAWGRSIGCRITCSPTVDPDTAPAFRIVYLICTFLIQDSLMRNDQVAIARILQRCSEAIGRLYDTKRASPKDLSPHNESILHYVADKLCLIEQFGYAISKTFVDDIMTSMITNLVTWGVPTDVYNRWGWTAFACATMQRPAALSHMHFSVLMAPDGPFIESSRPCLTNGRLSMVEALLPVVWQHPELVEGAEGGVLSLAATMGDEERVRNIVWRYPKSLDERDLYSHTPLHYAIRHPSCLRAILEASGSSLIDVPEMHGWSPIAWASHMGHVESVRILLASGCQLRVWTLSECHESCLEDVIMGLKQRRDELRLLALQHLTLTDADSLGLYENSVLDSNTFAVQGLLQEKGIVVPSQLSIRSVDRDQSVYNAWAHWARYGLNEWTKDGIDWLERLWALGFHDVDILWQESGHGSSCFRLTPVVRWFVEHGADYWTPINQKNSKLNLKEFDTGAADSRATILAHETTIAPAHAICHEIGYEYSFGRSEGSPWLLEKCFQVEVTDTCCCACSTGGCTPLKSFLDGCVQRVTYSCDPLFRAGEFLRLLRELPLTLHAENLVAIIRRLTFDALELTHTCESFGDSTASQPYSPEEVDEIRSAESAWLTLFDGLLVEFERIAHEDSGDKILIENDPEEFWMRRWLPRMTEILDKLNGNDLTEEEISAAEAIGVVWGPEPPPVTNQREEEIPEYTIEYVMDQLDKIMNER